ncbi:FtsX-like permease family protein [Streptomyces sp. 3N207]|uniref:FtsX-like permease family protein n=1 Tax=Streptomyces sp. 3N207 TaxID=3457417 RepID=UPI003FD5DC29
MTGRRAGRGVAWGRDLAMGARFAASGGREGWTRTLLTAVGVGLGVAVLLLAASVPSMIHQNEVRLANRGEGLPAMAEDNPPRSDRTVLSQSAGTSYHGQDVHGSVIQAEGDDPVRPAGVVQLPGPGELLVSPELKKLLGSTEGKELRNRLDGRIVGTIGDDGLVAPDELYFYQGSDELSADQGALRYADFGGGADEGPLGPVLLLIVVVACAVLVMPIAVFVATATRFGGEQRDRRLAALRLIGADGAMARRMAAGESLVGAALGLVLGAGFFALGRNILGEVSLFQLSVFPEDVVPSPLIGALIVLGVPAVSVAFCLVSMRGLIIEPLGVVRQALPHPRRLWWRLVPPALGALLLVPMAGAVTGDEPHVNEVQLVAGIVLLLSGVTLLLPWLVERIVTRLRGGPVSWQLAVRRLQLSSGTATRAVSGVTIAVAGAIALQMLFGGMTAEATTSARHDPDGSWVSLSGPVRTPGQVQALTRKLDRTNGVRTSIGYLESESYLKGTGGEVGTPVVVGSCSMLRKLASLRSCRDGQVFLVPSDGTDEYEKTPEPGGALDFAVEAGKSQGETWTVPASAQVVRGKKFAGGWRATGVLATPSAIPWSRLDEPDYMGRAELDPADPEALEHVRTTAFHVDPALSVSGEDTKKISGHFDSVRRGIFAASAAVLLLIGASMLVSMLEQLRERRSQLAVLVAFGTRRSTLGASVLWQAAVPVFLGLALASAIGLGLGWALLRLIGSPVEDWLVFLPTAGVGAGLIAVVTLLSLPPLWRLVRPEGLRTE